MFRRALLVLGLCAGLLWLSPPRAEAAALSGSGIAAALPDRAVSETRYYYVRRYYRPRYYRRYYFRRRHYYRPRYYRRYYRPYYRHYYRRPYRFFY